MHPTQIYETISMCLLLFFLLSYFPYRRWRGELMVFLMFGYGVHRFLSEMLRLDNDPGWFGLTLSQNISILVLAAGVILAIIVYRRPPIAGRSRQHRHRTPPVALDDRRPISRRTLETRRRDHHSVFKYSMIAQRWSSLRASPKVCPWLPRPGWVVS